MMNNSVSQQPASPKISDQHVTSRSYDLAEQVRLLSYNPDGLLSTDPSRADADVQMIFLGQDAFADTILVDTRYFEPQALDVGGIFKSRSDLATYLTLMGVTTEKFANLTSSFYSDDGFMQDVLSNERAFGSLNRPFKKADLRLSTNNLMSAIKAAHSKSKNKKKQGLDDWEYVVLTALVIHVLSPFVGHISNDLPLTVVYRPNRLVLDVDSTLTMSVTSSLLKMALDKSMGSVADAPTRGMSAQLLIPEMMQYFQRVTKNMRNSPSFSDIKELFVRATTLALIEDEAIPYTYISSMEAGLKTDRVTGLPLDPVRNLMRVHHSLAVDIRMRAFENLDIRGDRVAVLTAKFEECLLFFKDYPAPGVWIEHVVAAIKSAMTGAFIKAMARSDVRNMFHITRLAAGDNLGAALMIKSLPGTSGDRGVEVYTAEAYSGRGGLINGRFEMPASELNVAAVARICLSTDEHVLPEAVFDAAYRTLSHRIKFSNTAMGRRDIAHVYGDVSIFTCAAFNELDFNELMEFIAMDGTGRGYYYCTQASLNNGTSIALDFDLGGSQDDFLEGEENGFANAPSAARPRICIAYDDAYAFRGGLGNDVLLTANPMIYMLRSKFDLPKGGRCPDFKVPLLNAVKATGLLSHVMSVVHYEGDALRGQLIESHQNGIQWNDLVIGKLAIPDAFGESSLDALAGMELWVRMPVYNTIHMRTTIDLMRNVASALNGLPGYSDATRAMSRAFIMEMVPELRQFIAAHPYLFLRLMQYRRRNPNHVLQMASMVIDHYLRAFTIGRDYCAGDCEAMTWLVVQLHDYLENDTEAEVVVLAIFSGTDEPQDPIADETSIDN